MDLNQMLKNVVRWARVNASGSDDKTYPEQQMDYDGKLGNAIILMPYGLHANIDTDALMAIFSANGDAANRFAIGGATKNRPKLAASELVLFHPPTQTKIQFNADGSLDIDAGSNDVNITCGTANIDGDVTVSGTTDLGVGGAAIARVGDAVAVNTGTGIGTITAGSPNNTAN